MPTTEFVVNLLPVFYGHDHQICHILRHFDMPHLALEDLHRFLQTVGGAMDDAQCDQFHRDLMSELCNGSWFVVDNSRQLTQTHGGTRPGDGLADMLFGFIFGRLLRQLKEELVDAHLWDCRSWEDESARASPLTCSLSCSQNSVDSRRSVGRRSGPGHQGS